MKNSAKPFLRNAVILTAAAVLIPLMMNEWGAAQVIITVLLALLAAGQWALFLYLKKH